MRASWRRRRRSPRSTTCEEDWTRDDDRAHARAVQLPASPLRRARGLAPDDGYEDRSLAYQRAVRDVIEAQHRAVVDLRNQGEIADDVMRQIERELDLEEERLEI